MALAENFQVIENDSRWRELTLPEQQQIRRAWVSRRLAASHRPRDPESMKQLTTEAFQNAPEWAQPYQPSWKERHPSLYATGATAIGTPVKLLDTLQQIVANLGDPVLKRKRYPVTFGGLLEALTSPFQKTGEWMIGEGEETELPGGLATRIATDPMTYTGYGLGKRLAGEAVKNIPKGVKAIPRIFGRVGGLEKRRTLGEHLRPKELKKLFGKKHLPTEEGQSLSEWIGEIPRSWTTWGDPQRQIYKVFMQRGQRYIPKEQLQRVAETLVNAGPEQGLQAVRILNEGNPNKIRSLIAWAEMPSWGRKGLRGTKPVGKAGKQIAQQVTEPPLSVAEEITQPGSWADYLQKMMKEPEL